MAGQPTPPIADSAPSEPHLTDYDHAHLVTYLRLLDAAAEGAPWEDVARIVLNLDPVGNFCAARKTYDSHLARAQWMTRQGYRHLLGRSP